MTEDITKKENFEYVCVLKKPTKNCLVLGKILKDDENKRLKIQSELLGSLKKEDILKLLEINYFQKKYINEIFPIFKNYFYKEKHFKLIKHLIYNKIDFEKIFKFPENNEKIYEYKFSKIWNFYYKKYDIDPLFFEELRDFVVSGVGRGEFLFGIFTGSKNLIDTNKGDLVLNETIIEIKGLNGKLHCGKISRFAKDCQKDLKHIFNEYDLNFKIIRDCLKKKSISHTIFTQFGSEALINAILNHKYKEKILQKIICAHTHMKNEYKPAKRDIEAFENALQSKSKNKICAFLLSIHLTYYILNEYKNKDLIFIFLKKNYKEFVIFKSHNNIHNNYKLLKKLNIRLHPWENTTQTGSYGIIIK